MLDLRNPKKSGLRVQTRRPTARSSHASGSNWTWILIPLALIAIVLSIPTSSPAQMQGDTSNINIAQPQSDQTELQNALELSAYNNDIGGANNSETTTVVVLTEPTDIVRVFGGVNVNESTNIEDLSEEIQAQVKEKVIPFMSGLTPEQNQNEVTAHAMKMVYAPYTSSDEADLKNILMTEGYWLKDQTARGNSEAAGVRQGLFAAFINSTNKNVSEKNMLPAVNNLTSASLLALGDQETTVVENTTLVVSDEIARLLNEQAEQKRLQEELDAAQANAINNAEWEVPQTNEITNLVVDENQVKPQDGPLVVIEDTPATNNSPSVDPNADPSSKSSPDSDPNAQPKPNEQAQPQPDPEQKTQQQPEPQPEQLTQPQTQNEVVQSPINPIMGYTYTLPNQSTLPDSFPALSSTTALPQWVGTWGLQFSLEAGILSVQRLWELLSTGGINYQDNTWLVLYRRDTDLFNEPLRSKLPEWARGWQLTDTVFMKASTATTNYPDMNLVCKNFLQRTPQEIAQASSSDRFFAENDCLQWVVGTFAFKPEPPSDAFFINTYGAIEVKTAHTSGGRVDMIYYKWIIGSPVKPGMIFSTYGAPDVINYFWQQMKKK